MNTTLTLVIYMAILTLALLLLAALIRCKAWTMAGMKIALGNREDVPPATPFAARTAQTAQNTVEAFIVFTAISLVAQASGIQSPRIATGAQIFFIGRLLYIPVYYAGIVYLRTMIWGFSTFGMALMVSALV